METVALWTTSLVLVGTSAFLLGTLVRSIVHERRASGIRKIWRNFGLSITFATLFLVSWVAQGLAEWTTFVHEQEAHGQVARLSDFWVEFGQSTLENWQSEFLQLFSFVVVSAVLIHHGSSESKDGTERIEKTVNEIRGILREAGPPERSTPGPR
jgi:ABC-type transport system involved in cytochrome bd biosynthesis fused ATPase/permease subunit